MKLSGKIIMLAAGTAVLSSAVTAVAMKRALFNDGEAQSYSELFDQGGATSGHLTKVAQLPASHSDFTTAAESTINGVVSIKSYATPRGYSQNSGTRILRRSFFRIFLRKSRREPSQSASSGTAASSAAAVRSRIGCDHKCRRLYSHEQPCH